jgi:hypothetical protein
MIREARSKVISLAALPIGAIGRLFRSIRKKGLVETAKRVPAIAAYYLSLYLPSAPWRGYLDRRFDRKFGLDRRFDRKFGVDTARVLFLPERKTDPRFEDSVEYDPTPRRGFLHMLRQVPIHYRDFVFIDMGCGKGKVLLLATELGFKQVIGVELSTELLGAAADNLRVYFKKTGRDNRCQLVCMDAGDYQTMPCEPTVFYFYNPFGEKVMRRVLRNIEISPAAAPREAYLVYLTPEQRGVLDESGFLELFKQASLYSIYKTLGDSSKLT